MVSTEQLLSPRECAARLGVSRSWIYGAVARGILRCYRLPSIGGVNDVHVLRIPAAAVNELLERGASDGPLPR